MIRYPLGRFVDAPTLSAGIRFDFNDDSSAEASTWPLADGWSIGMPSLDGEPDSVGVEYGLRTMTFGLVVAGPKTLALRKQSALARELRRRRNWFFFQLDQSSAPVWFRTYRPSEPGDLSFERVYNNSKTDQWQITINIPADAFGYRERVTTAAITMVNRVVDNSGNRNEVVLPAVGGDAPTSVRVTVAPSAGSVAGAGSSWLLALVAGDATSLPGTTAKATGLVQGAFPSSWVGNENVIGPVQDSTNSINDQYRQIAAVDAHGDLTPGTLTGLMAPLRGRYKVLVRTRFEMAQNIATSYWVDFAQLIMSSSGVDDLWARGEVVTRDVAPVRAGESPAYTNPQWIDVGDFTFPQGLDIPVGVDGTFPTSRGQFRVGSDNPGGHVRVDGFVCVPVDGPSLVGVTSLESTFDYRPINGTVRGTWDGDAETFWAQTGAEFTAVSPTLHGDFLVADPAAAQNRLIVIPLLTEAVPGDPPASASAITHYNATWTVTASWYERVLWLGDGA